MATTYDPTSADPGQIEKIPAGDLIIDPNVRTSVRLDKSFISSIRVYGFQQCPVGYRDDDGKVHITMGQRRTSAALEIGWDVVPIVVKPKVIAEHDRSEELRILSQLAENEQRESLTDSERVAGYKQLALLGVSDDQIARKTNAPKQHVQTALAVAGSEVAAKVLQAKPITLEQAAYFIEFAEDAQAVEQLTQVIEERPEQIDHAAARIRKDRQIAAAVAELTRKLEGEGWEVEFSKYSYGIDVKGAAEVGRLYRSDDAKKQRLDVDQVSEYSGRIAVVYGVNFGELADAKYFIKNFAKQGLEVETYGAAPKGPLTDEEKEARRQKRIDKAEMIAATEVRRAWIQDFISTRNVPNTVDVWISHVLLETDTGMGLSTSNAKARDYAAGILGMQLAGIDSWDTYSVRRAFETRLQEHPTEARRIMLAYAIASAEVIAGDPKHAWFATGTSVAPYLEQLARWGYTLSDVEQRLIDKHHQERVSAEKRRAVREAAA